MRARTSFILAVFAPAFALLFVAQAFVPASSRTFPGTVYAAPNDFQVARQLIQQGDAFRRKGEWDKARRSYADALASLQAVNAQRLIVADQSIMDLCDAMPALNLKAMKDGTYRGKQMGFVAEVAVEVTVKDGALSALRILSAKESRPLKSLDTVPGQILAGKTPSVDACTGATVTSYAIMQATVKALKQAQPQEKPATSATSN